MPNQLSVYNGALRLCGIRKLSSLTDSCESRRVLDDIWNGGEAVKYCLEQGWWTFATRTVEMTSNSDYSPDFGHQFIFDKPDDYVKTVAICQDGGFSVPLTDYSDESSYWSANQEVIYVKYISNDAAFGFDYSRWNPTFTEFVEAYLAIKAVSSLSQSDQKLKNVASLYADALKNARAKDAMNKPSLRFPSCTWVRSRLSGRLSDKVTSIDA